MPEDPQFNPRVSPVIAAKFREKVAYRQIGKTVEKLLELYIKDPTIVEPEPEVPGEVTEATPTSRTEIELLTNVSKLAGGLARQVGYWMELAEQQKNLFELSSDRIHALEQAMDHLLAMPKNLALLTPETAELIQKISDKREGWWEKLNAQIDSNNEILRQMREEAGDT
ncbi:hypothetical protein AMC83_CH01964 [Rhizobium phaseoli]|uniref:hypothetical protein n=1 Tax=Rhizobium phaseoli TaxID=396 RepID=UPI0007EBF47A|nr:hypothetical protein [Rhizobium phaseoli]ANL71947.1 hypothetical protein AMC83_CH01964 [Rhizobium phaseoli]